MRFYRKQNSTNKNADIAFFLYFTGMALFFTKTYIQLALQLGILAYVAYFKFSDKIHFNKAVKRNLTFLFAWFGVFTIFAKLSEGWAYSQKADSNTVLTLFRILAIAVALFLYVTDYSKAISVIKSFIYSNVIMSLTVLLTTPLSQYGKAGDEGFGNIIGQQRNVFGAIMSFMVLLCILFYQYENFKHGKKLAIFFTFSLLCSGSRGAMLQLLIILILYVVTIPGLKRKFKYISCAIVVGIVGVVLLQNIPYLYETVWIRFEGLINTVLGIDVAADSSAQGRELYKVLAWEMFDHKPILGYGVDGFFCFLRDVEFVEGVYLPPRYSHCNFTEIASCFGIVGMIIWYSPVFYVLIKSFMLRKAAPHMNTVFIILTSMIILDYARIPWMTHISMYTYFCIILFFFFIQDELKQKQGLYRRMRQFGSLSEVDD